MRIHRFYLTTPISGSTFDIADRDLVHQWKSVFRYNVGSQVILFDGSGVDYTCVITSLRNLGGTVSVSKKTSTAPAIQRKNVYLCMALIKKDNFDVVVQKATELGVSHIIPLVCEHSEKRKLNLERMQKIAIEATEQSGRGDVPIIFDIKTLAEVFAEGLLPQDKVVFHTDPQQISFTQWKNTPTTSSVATFVGPEGGFSDKEIALLKQYNVPIVSVGSQILRAETAAIAVASLLLLS